MKFCMPSKIHTNLLPVSFKYDFYIFENCGRDFEQADIFKMMYFWCQFLYFQDPGGSPPTEEPPPTRKLTFTVIFLFH